MYIEKDFGAVHSLSLSLFFSMYVCIYLFILGLPFLKIIFIGV